MSGVGMIVASVVILSTISIMRKNKENYEAPSRETVQIVSSALRPS